MDTAYVVNMLNSSNSTWCQFSQHGHQNKIITPRQCLCSQLTAVCWRPSSGCWGGKVTAPDRLQCWLASSGSRPHRPPRPAGKTAAFLAPLCSHQEAAKWPPGLQPAADPLENLQRESKHFSSAKKMSTQYCLWLIIFLFQDENPCKHNFMKQFYIINKWCVLRSVNMISTADLSQNWQFKLQDAQRRVNPAFIWTDSDDVSICVCSWLDGKGSMSITSAYLSYSLLVFLLANTQLCSVNVT